MLVLACCLGAALPLFASAQAASAPTPPISQNDPLVQELKIKAERIRRCNGKARALWDGLTPQDQESLRTALSRQTDVSEVVQLLRYGQRSEAEAQTERLYATDKRHATLITSLIGYANGIE